MGCLFSLDPARCGLKVTLNHIYVYFIIFINNTSCVQVSSGLVACCVSNLYDSMLHMRLSHVHTQNGHAKTESGPRRLKRV